MGQKSGPVKDPAEQSTSGKAGEDEAIARPARRPRASSNMRVPSRSATVLIRPHGLWRGDYRIPVARRVAAGKAQGHLPCRARADQWDIDLHNNGVASSACVSPSGGWSRWRSRCRGMAPSNQRFSPCFRGGKLTINSRGDGTVSVPREARIAQGADFCTYDVSKICRA